MIVRGDYRWKDNIPDGEVVFVPSKNDKFLIQTNDNKK